MRRGQGAVVAGLRGKLEQLANLLVPSALERQRRRAIQLFKQSAAFDRNWYLEHYPDVAASGTDPARHYLISGWQEGRDPGPLFSTTAYLRANADVAALGVNPLLHYLEHGQAEGRGASVNVAPRRKAEAPLETLGPAAPCASFPRTKSAHIRWRRHARVQANARDIVEIDGQFIGEHRDDQSRQDLAASFAWLAHLSGAGPLAALGPMPVRAKAAVLLDAWHSGQGVLRTRWEAQSGATLVVRAIQFAKPDPTFVGEARIECGLDVSDAMLDNPYFPILFVFVDQDGWIAGWQALLFPSHCRGGLHYPERLAVDEGATGIDALNDHHIEQLIALERGQTVPMLAGLEVDLRGATGAHPLFQRDFQDWLRRVARLSVRPIPGSAPAGAEYLAEAVEVEARRTREPGPCRLVLASDMVPSLAIITASFDAALPFSLDEQSFIVSGEERSLPSTLVVVPNDLPDELPADFIPLYPRVAMRSGEALEKRPLPLLAIRAPRARPLSEAELLVPIAVPALATKAISDAITFIVPTDGQPEEQLAETLRSLAVQTGINPPSIVLVGSPTTTIASLASQLFESVCRAADLTGAAIRTGSALVGYCGAGIIFHDRRTVATVANMLRNSAVASASVVLVSVEQRGKGWLVQPVDAGEYATMTGESQPEFALPTWRATMPQLRPPSAFWMTRKGEFASWLANAPAACGRHLCTSLVTASVRIPRNPVETTIRVPPALVAARVEMLVG